MLINGMELSSLGIQLHDRVLTSNIVETTQDWLEGDIQPTFIRQQDKFKSMRLQFLITEKNEETAFLMMSKLTMMLRKATIVFDDMDLLFDVVLDGKTSQSRLKNGNFILTVNLLSDYAKGATEVYTTDSRATDYFYLNILYYQKGNILLSSDKVLIKASQFNDLNITFEKLGIDVNKYRPDYYNEGKISNFEGRELTYENLHSLQTLIVNYAPTSYYKEMEYFLESDEGGYTTITTVTISFTKELVDSCSTIGQIVDLSLNKPNGYRARTNFNLDFTFENLLAFSPLEIYYDKITNEKSKDIAINYYVEADGLYSLQHSQIINVREGNIVEGTHLKDIINVNAYKPERYHNNGICEEYDLNSLVTFESLQSSYDIKYALSENVILVEYYLGSYPDWSRITTATYKIKYHSSFENSTDIVASMGIDLNKYLTDTYNPGVVHNLGSISSFEEVLNLGVLQVYYAPKDYTIQVSYVQEETALGYKDVVINDYMFISNPVLSEIIDINAMLPEGFIFSPELSYDGEVSLSALTAASPIIITYVPVEEVKTKSILIKYKQELASAFSTLNTSIVTIEESAVGGGIKLSDLIDLNAYRPEYYDAGIIDGASSSSVLLFDEIQGAYDVLYLATTYDTPVRYYTDEISNYNWIGSESLNYRIIDFTTSTTLIDLGLNINAFKPSYCGDGIVDYEGVITFTALRNLDAINVVYMTETEPEDPDGIDYPHRILFLQHNDMGAYEQNFPSWTLNHAYINTGVTVQDMSKLTVQCEVVRVFETEPLYNVNVGDAYLFGSVTPQGSYYIKYVNNTAFKPDSQLTGVNTFNVAAGYGTPELVIEETSSEGFSRNTGIIASSRDGYSYATLTYTNPVQSNSAPMNVPLYLFACNQNGYYKGGIAGVGMAGCKIYYNDVLIRDMVPVQFYDKIGDKVAPSNCFYDKITQSFFEDARGLNSFNIVDDPAYTDTNPEHMIGCCYVNYYKDNVLFNNAVIWFRGSDFVGKDFVLNDKLFVDYYQPQFYGSGEIVNLDEIGDITFNNLKNKIIDVVYKSTGYNVVVNYWKDNKDAEGNKLATEVISLTEKDFNQVPTFGDLIPLLKYKPDGYKVNYSYPETKVTLNRIMQHSPYDIIYTPVENPKKYQTVVSYYRKRFGIDILNPINAYELMGQKVIELDETQFADGVYIEDYIGEYFNEYYPVSPIEGIPFYAEGAPYEWYLKDEMLDTPDNLKAEYLVSYEPVPVYIDVNYYTDVVEEENLVASTTWEIKIDNWPDDSQFYLVDELPNSYMDKYKPVICGGGRIHEPEKVWTFESLAAAGEISIVYDTLEEPHDPESTMWPSKVLWFARATEDGAYNRWNCTNPPIGRHGEESISSINVTTPYFDLGYVPKEIGRLRMETKAYALNTGAYTSKINRFGFVGDGASYFLGYYGGMDYSTIAQNIGQSESAENTIIMSGLGQFTNTAQSNYSPNSSGWMGFKGHTVRVGGFVYTSPLPQFYDGHAGFNLNTGAMNEGYDSETVREMFGGWRRGYFVTQGDNWEDINTYKDYSIEQNEGYGDTSYPYDTDDQWLTGNDKNGDFAKFNSSNDNEENDKYVGKAVAFNPLTMTLDAYNDYLEVYDYRNSQNPRYVNVENKDIDLFTRRCKPKGSISLFITTNPDTGKINWQPFTSFTYLGFSGLGMGPMQSINLQNPWGEGFNPTITITQQVITGTAEDGTPIYENKTTTRNIAFAPYKITCSPCVQRSLVWYVKIWDRDKLVRDLVPVNAGDQIYDYIAPADCLFDKVTEIFFSNQNVGGTYQAFDEHMNLKTKEVRPEDVAEVHVSPDPTVWGNIVVNYYDDKNNFLGNQYVEIPVHYKEANMSIYEICRYNDFKPNDFYHDGMIDVDLDFTKPNDDTLKAIYEAGSINIYYKLITFTKTVVYYQGNSRVGSKDLFYSLEDIDKAETLEDLGIDVNLYASDDFAPGRIVFNEKVIADDDIKAFIDASSPIVVYDKLTKEEAPNTFYVEYYRAGAYDDTLITIDETNPNYLNCDLDAVALNPNGVIKYANHYHTALYEDEKQDYFIAYQVDVKANYVPVHKGPARRYGTLAIIVDKGRYTIVEERAGWGRLKEYPTGWIMLSYTEPVTGPGQNPDYDEVGKVDVTIPFGERFTITRMTIDRLWCYSPDYASWVKAEEISFDQSGKLYNALAINVLHLDEIDWTAATSLASIGIYPEAYKLKYHDETGYIYEGEYTQEAFSNLHSLEFVYPETVYAYNCIYYADSRTAEQEVGRVSFSCSMSDWNPDWDTFIATSWRTTEDGDPINPTLYRDTELTLTWDYFEIDKNLFKPEKGNYNDGMFLWNPRTYENSDIYFTFEEIVTTGVQEILYLPTLNNYKASFGKDWVIVPLGLENFELNPKAEGSTPGVWDIEFKYQRLDGPDRWEGQLQEFANGSQRYYANAVLFPNFLGADIIATNAMENQPFNSTPAGVIDLYKKSPTTLTNGVTLVKGVYITSSSDKYEYYNIVNFSNKRNATFVHSYGNDLTGYSSKNQVRYKSSSQYISEEITKSLNLNDEKYYRLSGGQKALDKETLNVGCGGIEGFSKTYSSPTGGGTENNTTGNYRHLYDTLWYYVKVWKNYHLEHLFVPIPKGTWMADGTQAPWNTFYDAITNTFCEAHSQTNSKLTPANIYKLGDDPTISKPVDYFETWNFNYTDCEYIVQTTAAVAGYKYPDELAIKVADYPSGTIIPVRRYTADAENRVLGEWYYNGFAWFKTDSTTILPTDSYVIEDIVPGKTVAIKGDSANTQVTYKSYLGPDETTVSNAVTFKSEHTLRVDFKCGDFYWSGTSCWIPIEYTEDNYSDININYAVAIDTLTVYSHPIENDTYKTSVLLSGDRVTATKKLVKDEYWQYIGIGWIYTYNTVSEIV